MQELIKIPRLVESISFSSTAATLKKRLKYNTYNSKYNNNDVELPLLRLKIDNRHRLVTKKFKILSHWLCVTNSCFCLNYPKE